MPTRYADYDLDDDRVIACAYRTDEGPCPDGCGWDITSGDAIAHDGDLGAWVLAEHPDEEF